PTELSGWRTVLMKEGVGDELYTLNANTGLNLPQLAIVTNGGLRTVHGTSRLPLNTWTYLTGTYDGTTLRLYVNGNQVASQAVTGVMVTSNAPLRMGGNSIWGEFFSGRIDEVRIYDRALTPAEIQTDMNTPLP
ncbi:MAG: LamG domain-containing protein, partial [Myxococcaceae bacterium]|nr:LamG domain-containing protein [Myxococcaceae bacterium]